MEKLLKEKLKLAIELKDFTTEINNLCLKTQYSQLSSMLEERQNLIDDINKINGRIKEEEGNGRESNQIKKLKDQIKGIFVEVTETDKIIRKNINHQLTIVKEKLNNPKSTLTSKSLNIKA
ncbi:MAG: hypothetical protein GX339_01695 [Tissierellia bacterium]|nr:hypothetical protein [Tissierellia bacterium]